MRPWAVRSAASASQPAKTKAETPACVSSVSSAPGRPASQTTAPARRNACVAGIASRAYISSDEHRHASLAPEVLNASIIASRVANPSSIIASMPTAAKNLLEEVGVRAESGEEDFRPRGGAREHSIGSVAKRFERFGETNARQRFEHQRRGGWQCHRRDIEHRHRRFRELGEIAGAGERILAPG